MRFFTSSKQHMNKILAVINFITIVSCAQVEESEAKINLVNTIQSFEINQSWSQEPDGFNRNVFYRYPVNDNSSNPVAIVLHGNGGDAENEINKYSFLTKHVIVAPQGYKKSWNIGREESKAPDVDFIGKIITQIVDLKNIDKNKISIIGYSNGSALINQLLIELKSINFESAVCAFSQLNTLQYRNGTFWSRSSIDSDVHDLRVSPNNNKRILSFAGTEDKVCPYYGGLGIFNYNFINAEEVAFIWAKANNYQNQKINNPTLESENIYKFSYLQGNVVHYKLVGAGHGFNEKLKEKTNKLIKDFIEK